jgi:hypothetical protein
VIWGRTACECAVFALGRGSAVGSRLGHANRAVLGGTMDRAAARCGRFWMLPCGRRRDGHGGGVSKDRRSGLFSATSATVCLGQEPLRHRIRFWNLMPLRRRRHTQQGVSGAVCAWGPERAGWRSDGALSSRDADGCPRERGAWGVGVKNNAWSVRGVRVATRRGGRSRQEAGGLPPLPKRIARIGSRWKRQVCVCGRRPVRS